MVPDNRITRLLPVWPTLPLKEFGGKPRARDTVHEEKKSTKRRGSGKAGEDGKPHIDTYA